MFFQNVVIKNYKSINKMDIEFAPGINLIIGDNGAGKTTILEALTTVLGGFLSGIVSVSAKGILQSDVRIESTLLGDASSSIQYMTPVSVECNIDIEGKQYTWTRIRESETGSSRTKIIQDGILNYSRKISNNKESRLPLLSYMGTNRVSQPKREDYGSRLKIKLDDRRCGYIGCLDSSLDTKAIKAWCLKMEMVAFNKNQQVEEYEAFKKLVSSVMKSMVGMSHEPSISYSRVFESIVYTEGETTLPISYLSAGYQSLLWIVMDISYRLALLNPGYSDFREATGIVLIDELDMHLHPKWQWEVINALETAFPNIQFIIATHSPIIISSCKKGKLIRIDADQTVSYPENAYAFSIDDVVEFRQGSLGTPKELRQLANEFDEAMNLGKYDDANIIYQKMKISYGEDNSEVKNIKMELGVVECNDSNGN